MSTDDNKDTNAAKSLVLGLLSVIANAAAITLGVYYKAISPGSAGAILIAAFVMAILGGVTGWRSLSSGVKGSAGMAVPGLIFSGISLLVWAVGSLNK